VRQFVRHARAFIAPGARVLEIGPDRLPSTLRAQVDTHAAAGARWDTLELTQAAGGPPAGLPLDPHSLAYRVDDPYRYPIADGSYDVVVSANVVEHVPRVWRWMAELARVCRPGGVVITVGPVSWPYHAAPVDCWRIYPAGMRALSEESGLEVLVSEWGCAELDWLDRRMPGRLGPKRVWQRLSGLFLLWHAATGLPPQGAYDAVTVARKPAEEPLPPAAAGGG
jgi:SAM-dependent methyltransferase